MADGQALLNARFGMDMPGVEVPDVIAPLLDRRVARRYTDQAVPDTLLDALLAAAQSAPAKSDLQQYSVVVMRDKPRIKQIADWIGTMDWIAAAPVFLIWCGDMRRGQKLCEMHDMPHANNNLDTFLNTAVDCALAMAQFMAAADAVGLGSCPISYVRSHIERVSPLLGLPAGVYPVAGLTAGWPQFRRPVAMRLPPSIVVHRERYDDSNLPADVAGYDDRRPGEPFQNLEKRYFDVGNLGFPVWHAFGGRVGMMICNDRRWPEAYRVMGLQGVEMVTLGFNTPSFNSQKPDEGPEMRAFHHTLSVQAGAYQNSTWVVAVAKAGVEDGHPMFGCSLIVDPDGRIVAQSKTEADELLVHACDLDATRFGKATIFDFARHRRIEHYGRITAQTGVVLPNG